MQKKIVVALDCDDVLYECNRFAVARHNEEHPNMPIKFSDLTSWEAKGDITDQRLKYFGSPTFIRDLPLVPFAKEFVERLMSDPRIDLVFVTAVNDGCKDARSERLRSDFGANREQIIITNRKDLVHADILVDDAPHNILASPAKLKILKRSPWNEYLTGMNTANTLEEALFQIMNYCERTCGPLHKTSDKVILCLVGPSCSGKTSIANILKSRDDFIVPISHTTRDKRTNESDDAYYFITEEQFHDALNNGQLVEHTVYASRHYGLSSEEIDRCLSTGKNLVIPVDIAGAQAIKMLYGEQAVSCFVFRTKDKVIESILQRDCPIEDKKHRLLSLNDEYKNHLYCDFTINNNADIESAAEALLRQLELFKSYEAIL